MIILGCILIVIMNAAVTRSTNGHITGKQAVSLLERSNAISNELIMQSDFISNCKLRNVGEECVESYLDSEDKTEVDVEQAVLLSQRTAAVENFAINNPEYPPQSGESTKFQCPSSNDVFPVPNHEDKYYQCTGGFHEEKQCKKKMVFDEEFGFCRPKQRHQQYKIRPKRTLFGNVKTFFRFMTDSPLYKKFSPFRSRMKVAPREIEMLLPKSKWYCVRRLSLNDPKYTKISQCLEDAVKARATQLILAPGWCSFQKRSLLPIGMVRCTTTSVHVISVRLFLSVTKRINKDHSYWFETGPEPSLTWTSVALGGITIDSVLPKCFRKCQEKGSDFGRYSHNGCSCGFLRDNHVHMAFYETLKGEYVDPGVTVALHPFSPDKLSCSAVSDEPVAAGRVLTDTLDACSETNNIKYIKNKTLSCSESKNDLLKFRRSLCDMNHHSVEAVVTKKVLDRYRNITTSSYTEQEYSLRWLPLENPYVDWSLLSGIETMEQCLYKCQKRFISVNGKSCSCGSLRGDIEEKLYWDWIDKQPLLTPDLKVGSLFYDRINSNAPEAWGCTQQPSKWMVVTAAKLSDCLLQCSQLKLTNVAFGRGSCRCGNVQSSMNSLRPVSMVQCANFSRSASWVLNVARWTDILNTLLSKGYQVHWVSSLPYEGIEWIRKRNKNVFQECIAACEDVADIRLVALGVYGCFCGRFQSTVSFNSLFNDSLTQRLTHIHPDLGLHSVIVVRTKPSSAFRRKPINWVVVRNTTKVDDDKNDMKVVWRREVSSTSTEQSRKIRRKLEREVQASDEVVDLVKQGPDSARILVQRNNQMTLNGIKVTTTDTLRNINVEDVGNSEQAVLDVREKEQKVTSTEAQSNITKQTETARATLSDGLEIKIGKKTDIEMDRTSVLKHGVKDYTNLNVIGVQVDGTNEQVNSSGTENWIQHNVKQNNILISSIDAKDNHLISEQSLQKIGRYRVKSRAIDRSSEGKTVTVQKKISGWCYSGQADVEKLIKPSGISDNPFRCVVACFKLKRVYAVFNRSGSCLCAENAADLGEKTDEKSSTGLCTGESQRAVFTSVDHVQLISRDLGDMRMQDFSQISGHRSEKTSETFSSEEHLTSNKVISSLESNHVKRSDRLVQTSFNRVHKKNGYVDKIIESSVETGFYLGELRLRMSVQRKVRVSDEVLLNIIQHQNQQQALRPAAVKEIDDDTKSYDRKHRHQDHHDTYRNKRKYEKSEDRRQSEPSSIPKLPTISKVIGTTKGFVRRLFRS